MDRLWAMQVFVRVVECGSFTRAAESLDLANATVTASVHNLEKHLGVTLIQRNTRVLRLTDEGSSYYERCLDLLKQVEEAESDVRGKNDAMRGVLRVETPVAFGRAILCPLLPRFTARHPGLSVAVTLTNQPQSLIERGTDIALRIDQVDDAALVARPIYQSRYVTCASPIIAKKHGGGSPQDIDPGKCLSILTETRYTVRPWKFARGDEQYQITPAGHLAFNTSDALIEAALANQGFIHVLDVFVNAHLTSGALVEMCADWTTTSRTFHVVTPKNRFVAPKVRAFTSFLVESLDAQKRPLPGVQIGIRSRGRGRTRA
ncbi:MAG: LysR family transcriptional regulator [Steroidobacteraceae bacterium]